MTSKETVVITGCSNGGISSAPVQLLQHPQRAPHVYATSRIPSKMSALLGLPNVTMLTLDVVKSADASAAVELETAKTGGTLRRSLIESNTISVVRGYGHS